MIAEHFPGPIIYNKEKCNPFSKWNRQNWKAEKLLSYRSAETYWELCFIIRFSDESFLVQAPVLSCWINSRKLFSYKLIRWLETKLCSCIWRWWSSNYFQQRISVSCSPNHWHHQTAQSHHQSSKYKFPGNSLKHNKNTTVVPVNARFVAITILKKKKKSSRYNHSLQMASSLMGSGKVQYCLQASLLVWVSTLGFLCLQTAFWQV